VRNKAGGRLSTATPARSSFSQSWNAFPAADHFGGGLEHRLELRPVDLFDVLAQMIHDLAPGGGAAGFAAARIRAAILSG
jgi:hypothetical protein